MRTLERSWALGWRLALVLAAVAVANGAAAVDGVVEINQTRALAGGITGGDGAGYPVTLSETGSYRLTSDLVVQSNETHAIAITVDGPVALDLNHFSILGPTRCSQNATTREVLCLGPGPAMGISADPLAQVTVRNGTIRGTGAEGVFLGISARVIDVRVRETGSTAIRAGSNAVIQGCTAGLNGIEAGDGTIVRDSVAANNGKTGMIVGSDAVVTGNVVRRNGDGPDEERRATGVEVARVYTALRGTLPPGRRAKAEGASDLRRV